jgi:peptide/nickel transport system substrate-binding protein
VALDREALLLKYCGEFAGELADGVIAPNLGVEYAPTGWAVDLFGEPVPPDGNPDLARRLIEESGEPMPDLTFDYDEVVTRPGTADLVINSLGRAGINVAANPMGDDYWTAVFNDDVVHEFGVGVWGADWPNASTIVPIMFTDVGGWNLSRVRDQDFLDQVHDALTTLDREEQATMWQDLNKEAMQRAYVVPFGFVRMPTLGGTRIGPLYPWAPYASWPFAEMGVLSE